MVPPAWETSRSSSRRPAASPTIPAILEYVPKAPGSGELTQLSHLLAAVLKYR
jgi:hypothetical protein